jgi:hypothetical protein
MSVTIGSVLTALDEQGRVGWGPGGGGGGASGVSIPNAFTIIAQSPNSPFALGNYTGSKLTIGNFVSISARITAINSALGSDPTTVTLQFPVTFTNTNTYTIEFTANTSLFSSLDLPACVYVAANQVRVEYISNSFLGDPPAFTVTVSGFVA